MVASKRRGCAQGANFDSSVFCTKHTNTINKVTAIERNGREKWVVRCEKRIESTYGVILTVPTGKGNGYTQKM